MSILTKIFGDPNARFLKTLEPIVKEINDLEDRFLKMSDEELRGVALELKNKISMDKNGLKNALDSVLPEAFAAVREASRRSIGQRHYDVQLIGGMVLHKGQIAEMRTGEGKTLVATLPLYLNALAGKGVHLITVNDYLSRVGAGWMAKVFYALGLTTGVIIHDAAFIYDPAYDDDKQFDKRMRHLKPCQRNEAYACDITYGTNNEFGFDYLRDNMANEAAQMVQRDLFYAIVDEVDSILIDEARTPLIISAPAEESTDKYYKFSELVARLDENVDYNVDEKMRAATLTEAGIGKMEKWLGVENIYTTGGVREVHHIEQALKARVLFKLDRDYVVRDGEVIIVDEFTGRLMIGRRYSDGLHQAIEAKEKVKIQRESMTLATVTFQNYFRMYEKLSGMTGTAMTEAEEFSKIYNLDVTSIPTHRPMIRIDNNDLIYKSEEGKFNAVVKEAKERQATGQPILIGTISIQKNEVLAELMEREGLRPNVLNAKNHEREAKIIADAGRHGAITIATNMAGRGVDIMLGGIEPDDVNSEEWKKWKEDREKVLAAGGLHVIGTERHESRRIDNQLRGRAGRQGDPGSSRFYVSTEDDLMRIFGGDRMKGLMTTLNLPEDMPIENGLISKSIESAQKKVEGNNFDIRKHLVEYDDVLNKHRESIYKKRREILKTEGAEETKKLVLGMVESEIEQVVSFHTASQDENAWDLKEIKETINTIFPLAEDFKLEIDSVVKDGKLGMARAKTKLIELFLDKAKENYENMIKMAEVAKMDWQSVEKSILLRSIDTLWIEHLEAISSLRQGIGLRGYGQRDPLVEYKKEAYRMYNELNNLIQKEVVYSIFKIADVANIAAPNLLAMAREFSAPEKEAGNTPLIKGVGGIKDPEGNKVGRNDPCICGSGKKYKKCCGA